MTGKNKLVICTIGKLVYLEKLKDNTQNLQTFTALSKDMGRLYLIVQSRSRSFSISHHKNIVALFIPHLKNQLLNRLWFISMSVILGFKLNVRANVDMFQASEPTGSGIAGIILKLITRKKFLLHLQGDLFNLPRSQLSWFRVYISRILTKIACKFADKIRCVSKSIIAEAKKHGVPDHKLVLVPSRCDVRRFDPKIWRDKRDDIRNQLDLKNKKVAHVNIL